MRIRWKCVKRKLHVVTCCLLCCQVKLQHSPHNAAMNNSLLHIFTAGTQAHFTELQAYSLGLNSRSYTYTMWNQHTCGHTCTPEHNALQTLHLVKKKHLIVNAVCSTLSLLPVETPNYIDDNSINHQCVYKHKPLSL